MNIRADLAFYLGGPVLDDVVEHAEEWMENNPESSLSEYVDAMIEIGAL